MKNIKNYDSFINEAKNEPSIDHQKELTEYRDKLYQVIDDQLTEEEKNITAYYDGDNFQDEFECKIIPQIHVHHKQPHAGEYSYLVNSGVLIKDDTKEQMFSVSLYKGAKPEDVVRKLSEYYYLDNESIDKIVKLLKILNNYSKVDSVTFEKIIDRVYDYFSKK